jgi:Fic family protein
MNIKEIEQLATTYQKLTQGEVDYQKYAAYAAAHHSTAIEGSSLTENQVINLLEFGKPVANKPFSEHQMVYDYHKAMEFVLLTAKDKQPITPPFIKSTAAHVMQNTGGFVNAAAGRYDINLGEYRLGSVRAGSRQFPDYKKVPALVQALCDKANQDMPLAKTFAQKCEIAFTFHFELVSIHPFGDGNGRTSRLMMNYVQAYYGLPLSIVYKQDRIKYIDALELARSTNSFKPFFEFMCSQYRKLFTLEIKRLKK